MTDTQKEEPKKKKRVALLGFAPSYKEAPFKDESVEIWGINELWRYLPRWSRWFEMHKRPVFAFEGDREQAAHVQWLQQQDASKPIYMLEPQPDMPGSVAYPLREMADRFFPGQRPYFTSTISYMLALAIAEGFDEIGLYGIDLVASTEYGTQRPAAEYLIGLARGMGITVTVTAGSALLKSHEVYGYDQVLNAEKTPFTLPWFRARVAAIGNQREKTLSLLNHQDGLLEEAQNMLRMAEQIERGAQVS